MNSAEDHRNTGFPDAFDKFFFQKAWEVMWYNRGFMIKLVLLTAFLITVVLEIFDKTVVWQFNLGQIDLETAVPRDLFSLLFLIFLEQLIVLIPKAYLLIVFIFVLPRIYENIEVNFLDSLGTGYSRWIPLYAYLAFVTLLTGLGFFVFIIPGVLVIIQFTLLQFVVVLEDDVKIIPRSFQLISGKQWNVVGIYLIKIFVIVILSFPFLASTFSGALEPPSDFNSEGTVLSGTQFLYSFIMQVILAGVTYFITILFFQIYMMARIENNEIEVVLED